MWKIISGMAALLMALPAAMAESGASVASPDGLNTNPAIQLAASKPGYWSATYRLRTPTVRLAFSRTPDDRRAKEWRAQAGFRIVHREGADFIERLDGKAFKRVRVESPANFVLLPKDYAPFSDFSDGGLLIHSGRFFTCPIECKSGGWQMTLNIPPTSKAIVGGAEYKRQVVWDDGREGRKVYVGGATPVANSHFLAIVDPALPAPIRDRLSEMLPIFMDYFVKQLGDLQHKPMLFASYGKTQGSGYHMKGGTLPDQVFMHIFGNLPENIGEQEFSWYVGWFFAHEAAHMFQGDGTASAIDEESWVHEGSAELLAMFALAQSDPGARSNIEKRANIAEKKCAAGLTEMRLRDAAKAGRFELYYDCGLLMQRRFDRDIRTANPKSDGALELWRDYRARVQAGAPPGQNTYLAAVEALAGMQTAKWGRRISDERLPDPSAFLAESSVSSGTR